MSTFQEKFLISLKSAVLFGLVNMAVIYKFINATNQTNCPTNTGLLLSAMVFFVLTFLSMLYAPLSTGLKLKFSIYGTLIFYLISSPAMFSLTGSIFGNKIASVAGCPTNYGVLLHAAVYCFALVGLMYLP